jgi:mannose-6-phosphate isomerase-like protein (cupin superfamily)
MGTHIRLATLLIVVAANASSSAQEAPTGPARGAGPAAKQEFWVQKTKVTTYVPPNKPHTRLADLKAKYKGQGAWKETVVKDGESQADYVSMVPGTKVSPRLHPATPTLFVVFEGEMRWEIENQEAFTAKRGSMVNIPSWTIFSYEVTGTVPAVFIEVNAIHFDNVFPAASPAPEALPGRAVIKTRFNERRPTPYVAPNKPHFNLHDSIKANPARPGGVQVRTEHLYANANYGFADPNDPANPNRGNAARGGGPAAAPARGAGPAPADFAPNVPAGHLHPGSSEWWIVLTGQISAKFEVGSFIGTEGDILYAPPYMSHAMANHGPGGSCRVAIGWYDQEHFDPPVE